MTVSFDENAQERDCVVLFKFNGEFNVCVTVIEVVQKLNCCVFTVKQGEGIVNVPKPNRRASVVVKNPFLFKIRHVKILAKIGPKGEPMATPSIWS